MCDSAVTASKWVRLADADPSGSMAQLSGKGLNRLRPASAKHQGAANAMHLLARLPDRNTKCEGTTRLRAAILLGILAACRASDAAGLRMRQRTMQFTLVPMHVPALIPFAGQQRGTWQRCLATRLADSSAGSFTARSGIAVRLRVHEGENKSSECSPWLTFCLCCWEVKWCLVRALLDHIEVSSGSKRHSKAPATFITDERGGSLVPARPLFVHVAPRPASAIKASTIAARNSAFLVTQELIPAEGVGQHICRGTGLSCHLALGCTAAQVAQISGHKSIRTLLSRHLHAVIPPVQTEQVLSQAHISLAIPLAARILASGDLLTGASGDAGIVRHHGSNVVSERQCA